MYDDSSSPAVTPTRINNAGGSNNVYYILKDHASITLSTSLGSPSVVTDSTGTIVSGSEQRYYPYGESRLTATMLTDKLFTGQRDVGLGIYHYGARFRAAPPKRSGAGYSPKLGRFLSADTNIPVFDNPQSWNRFSYAVNNPIRYNDPDGHCAPACALAVPVLAVGAIFLLTAIAIHPASRAAALDSLDSMADIPGRTRDALNDLHNKINDTNSNRDEFKIKRSCKETPRACAVFAISLIAIVVIAVVTGGIDQDESNARSSNLTINTSTTTSTPPNTFTSTASCPPQIICPNTSTSTLTSSLTPTPTYTLTNTATNTATNTSTNTPTPTSTPTPIPTPFHPNLPIPY